MKLYSFKRIKLILLASTLSVYSAAVVSADICPALKQAKEAAGQRFVPIKGARHDVTEIGGYYSTIAMPGISDACTLNDEMDELSCNWEFNSVENAKKFFDEMKLAMPSCLGGYYKLMSYPERVSETKLSRRIQKIHQTYSASYPAPQKSGLNSIEFNTTLSHSLSESLKTGKVSTSIVVIVDVSTKEY